MTCALAAVIRIHRLPFSETALMKSSPGWHNLRLYYCLCLYALTIKLVEGSLTLSAITKGKIRISSLGHFRCESHVTQLSCCKALSNTLHSYPFTYALQPAYVSAAWVTPVFLFMNRRSCSYICKCLDRRGPLQYEVPLVCRDTGPGDYAGSPWTRRRCLERHKSGWVAR